MVRLMILKGDTNASESRYIFHLGKDGLSNDFDNFVHGLEVRPFLGRVKVHKPWSERRRGHLPNWKHHWIIGRANDEFVILVDERHDLTREIIAHLKAFVSARFKHFLAFFYPALILVGID